MNALDRLFLDRACELGERAIGNTSPNPAVGAVLVRDGVVIGEGYHHRAGEAHAEVNALAAAGAFAQGATLYVTLEPCNHTGHTPPCAPALIAAGVARVVVGARDPNPKTGGGGIAALHAAGIAVEEARSARAHTLIERFAVAIAGARPFVTLKMASSIDGYVASVPGAKEWLTGEAARAFVREARIAHDAVMVGAGTVRIDNPALTVRPAHHRLRDYVRIVACQSGSLDPASTVFAPVPGYAPTIVLAPAGLEAQLHALRDGADVMTLGASTARALDLRAALRALYERGISSVLCEGGPRFAAALLAAGVVDRIDWLVAPRFLSGATAAPVLRGETGAVRGLRFDRVEPLGADLLISGTMHHHV